MNQILSTNQEKDVLWWGGLAGIAGSFIFVIVIAIVIGFVGEDPNELSKWVERFPDIRAARTAENSGYLLSLILWIPSFLGLYVVLHKERFAAALFGTTLAVLGLVVLAVGALPHIATISLADLYHDTSATEADQASLALMWQATWGVFDAILVAGMAVLAAGILNLGIAMMKSESFGNFITYFTVLIGLVGSIATIASLIDPESSLAALYIFGLIVFHFVAGWRLTRLSQIQ